MAPGGICAAAGTANRRAASSDMKRIAIPYKEKVPAGEAGTKCLGSLGVGSGHHSPVVKGFRLSTGLLAVRRYRPHLPGCAGFSAHIADARTLEIGPGLLAAGEACLEIEAVALAGGRLGHGAPGRRRHRVDARRHHKRASDKRGRSYDAVNLGRCATLFPDYSCPTPGPSLR